MKTFSLFRWNVMLQFRHGFYLAYLIVSIMFIAAIYAIPDPVKSFLLPMIIFTDPAVLGFFFIGGIVLLERQDNSLQSLFVTPMDATAYILSKVFSLTFLCLTACFFIGIPSVFMSPAISFSPLIYFFTVLITSACFVLIGLLVVARIPTLTKYMFYSIVILLPIFVPLLDFFGLVKTPLFYLIPTHGSIRLMTESFHAGSVPAWEIALSFGSLTVWTVALFFWAKSWLNRYVLFKTGGEK